MIDSPIDSPLKPPCVRIDGSESLSEPSPNVPSVPYIQSIRIYCPRRYAVQGQNPNGERINSFSLLRVILIVMFEKVDILPSPEIFPDLLITVDFSILGITPTDPLTDTRFKVVSIVVGLTDDLQDVYETTSPIPIYPESYLLGAIGFYLRRKYQRPWLAMFSSILAVSMYHENFEAMTDFRTLQSQRTFFVSGLETLVPDTSPLIERRNNTGTLRIYAQDDVSEWYVESDYDIVGGLGASGGFWTSTSGIFVILFGSSLLWLMRGK